MQNNPFAVPNSEESFFRLSDINIGIANAIRQTFSERSFWVVAEISDLAVRKGHCYISLVEKPVGAASPTCEMKGIVWASSWPFVSTKFKSASGMELSKGMVILFRTVVRYDIKWGLSLVISDIDPKYTIGQIQIERDMAVSMLKSEGVYDNNRKIPIPVVAQRLAVISASDSRGYEDFMQKLEGNPYGYRFHCELFQSLLQGDKAAGQMVEQLISIFRRLDDFDAVVIVRGGGGSIDLNCFNDVRMARAVARFPLPVITGIGHTANRSVTDEVAYADRITPTDAADFFVEHMLTFENKVMDLLRSIAGLSEEFMVEEGAQLEDLSSRFQVGVADLLDGELGLLADMARSIREHTNTMISKATFLLAKASINVGQLSKSRVSLEKSNLDRFEKVLRVCPSRITTDQLKVVEGFEKSIAHLDPSNVLKRGFSITTKNGKSIKSPAEVQQGDVITTVLYEGKIESRV
jgi:exodeoxyribonuclease VII large subunit